MARLRSYAADCENGAYTKNLIWIIRNLGYLLAIVLHVDFVQAKRLRVVLFLDASARFGQWSSLSCQKLVQWRAWRRCPKWHLKDA